MAICNIIRRAAGHAAGAARSIARAQRYHHRQYSSIFSPAAAAANRGGVSGSLVRSAVPSAFHHYSTKSDEALLKVIESEINAHIESEGTNEADEAPPGFPFEIEDNPGYQTVTLRREYQGEDITVEVHMPDIVSGEEKERSQYNDDDDDEKESDSQIPLVVCVSKKDGPALEFGCTALPDEISIDSLSFRDPKSAEDKIAYEGPDFSDLDENLQKAFHKYLEMRGIKPSTTNFLHEYMIDKDGREYLKWLQNIKMFIQA